MRVLLVAMMAFVFVGTAVHAESSRDSSSAAGVATMKATPMETRDTSTEGATIPALRNLRSVDSVFGRPTTPSVGGVKLKANVDDDTKYECNGMICYCKGSFDCVSMIAADKMCDNDTVGCNDDLCVCSQTGTTGN